MTTPTSADAGRIRLSPVATVLFVLSAPLLLFGFLTLFATEPRSYFVHAVNQASFGALMLITGVLLLIGALVLVGVRSAAQQLLNSRRGW